MTLWEPRCQTAPMEPVDVLVAKDSIRELVYRYSSAIADRDVDLMVSLYVPDASFGQLGTGPDALRSMMDSTMSDLMLGVILVANHSITVEDHDRASGEVWARCYAQNDGGYYEQLIKYVDRYRRVGATGTDWRFEHRRHHLWFGQAAASPLAQAPAEWPINLVGVGRIPLRDPAVIAWREAMEGVERPI